MPNRKYMKNNVNRHWKKCYITVEVQAQTTFYSKSFNFLQLLNRFAHFSIPNIYNLQQGFFLICKFLYSRKIANKLNYNFPNNKQAITLI